MDILWIKWITWSVLLVPCLPLERIYYYLLHLFSNFFYPCRHHKAVADVDKHMQLGEEITNTCHEFYKRTKTGLGPEIAKFREGSDFYTEPGHPSTYILRPGTLPISLSLQNC